MASSFRADTAAYERWLRDQCDVVGKDLRHKHTRMRKNVFTFLRATYFRWARRIEAVCPGLAGAPPVLSVGDLHLENYGTWRDEEGRLVWGINDFDEAAVIAYPYDLVRLMTSTRLLRGLSIANRDAAEAILEGYRDGLARPRPTLLDEQATWMRKYVACSDAARDSFWKEVFTWPAARPPKRVAAGLARSLPKGAKIERFAARVAGGGSLGRPRYVAIAEWCGGRVVREAKALVPSAWGWAHGRAVARPRFLELATGAFRAPDPFLALADGFIVRRIAADSRKVELDQLLDGKPTAKLLAAMGFDLGAMHAAGPSRGAAVRADLERRRDGWLHDAAKDAAAAVEADYAAWVG